MAALAGDAFADLRAGFAVPLEFPVLQLDAPGPGRSASDEPGISRVERGISRD
ncbi:hypothetical protein AB0F52_48200 [Amycolatopsis sp. NPDC024027]|uniref:hypothetical protein n=1 Tax=Amycolatopsis sp. NPDC024027 TaxID=3154327 RepID=UPI0033FD94CD